MSKLRLAIAATVVAMVALAFAGTSAWAASSSGGQDFYGCGANCGTTVPPPPTTLQPVVLPNSGVNVGPATSPQVAATGGGLPFTGTDVVELVGIALVLLGGGAVLVRRTRVRRPADS